MEYKKYYASIEIKYLLSYFLRHIEDVRGYVNDSEEELLIAKYNEVINNCKELFDIANKIAETEKPPERILENPDRGIDDFLDSSSSGNDCGSGGCGGCSGNCKP